MKKRRNFTVNFFDVEYHAMEAEHLSKTLQRIAELDVDKRYEGVGIYADGLSSYVAVAESGPHADLRLGYLERHQTADLPPQGEIGIKSAPLGIKGNLVHESIFTYHVKRDVLAVLQYQGALRANRLCEYINSFRSTSPIELVPLLRHDAKARLKKMKYVRRVHVKYVSPVPIEDSAAEDLSGVIGMASGRGAQLVEVTMGLTSRKKDASLLGDLKAAVTSLMELVGAHPGAKVKTAEFIGRSSVDAEADVVDLIEDRVFDVLTMDVKRDFSISELSAALIDSTKSVLAKLG